MDGLGTAGSPHQTTSVTSPPTFPAPTQDLGGITTALEAVYSPQSSNEDRQIASSYLEDAKRHPQAPSNGYALALDKEQPAALRYYGLSMLEYSIKYAWEDYEEAQALALRNFVTELAKSVTPQDPLYLRNKIGQLWAEIAKRSWAVEWMDMDRQLVELWEATIVHQLVVLYILEMLAEEIFSKEDPIAGLRSSELGHACVEIFTPASVLSEHFPNRDTSLNVRHGAEGWLGRICYLLNWCLEQEFDKNELVHAAATRCLTTLKASFSWIMPRAVAATQCNDHICKALSAGDVVLRTASVDALNAIYSRSNLPPEDFVDVVCPMYTSASITLLENVYSWSRVGISDFDDPKYALCKKTSELLSFLANLMESKLHQIPENSDLPAFLSLLFSVMRNESLVVSIPVLHVWTKLLRSRLLQDSPVIQQSIGGLLETCCQRLVRYEHLPPDTDNVTALFIQEDIDTVPERHAFLGNYRRYCVDIVEVVVRKLPIDATNHILSQAETLFSTLYKGQPAFSAQSFSKSATPVLRVDAQVTVIDAAIKGFTKWIAVQKGPEQEIEADQRAIQQAYEQFCNKMFDIQFRDPEIKRKVIVLLVTVSTKAIWTHPDFAVSVLRHILNTSVVDDPTYPEYSEAVKSLQYTCTMEMQKLAMQFASHFFRLYDQLEQKINEVLAEAPSNDRRRMGYSAFLFIILHRSQYVSKTEQEARMRQQLKPIAEAWQDPRLTAALSTFQSFCELIGCGRLPEFLSSRNFQGIQDWTAQALDPDGQALQTDIMNRFQELPIRLTKTLLAASTDRLDEEAPAFEMASQVWADIIPAILPNLLRLVGYAQAFNNMSNWAQLPEEMQAVIRRILTDRFWQAGISTESRDEFFAKVGNSKTTYEGFASTVRGTCRQIRETSYWIIYGLIRFKDNFYGIPDLPEPLSQALFANAHALSSHHVSVLLTMTTQLIDGCPPHLRSTFLPQMLSACLVQLDAKITSEWDIVTTRIAQASEDDNLGDEMKSESILRQLTYSAVSLVYGLLDSQRVDVSTKHSQQQEPNADSPPKMSKFVLSTPTVLEPLIIFIKNALRMRDTRSCSLAIRTLRTSLLPSFRSPSPIRDFFCNELLQAAITSLHEPYFVDIQRDLASLIAQIVHLDDKIPLAVISSLPGLRERQQKVWRAVESIRNAASEKQVRALVLDLLKDVRGVSIHEQGRIERASGKKNRSKLEEGYMSVDRAPEPGVIRRGGSPELVGVADLLG